jgi:hypothetical protein
MRKIKPLNQSFNKPGNPTSIYPESRDERESGRSDQSCPVQPESESRMERIALGPSGSLLFTSELHDDIVTPPGVTE